MPLRPARCYTHFTSPPYTRKEYIPGVPPPKITKFEMGNRNVSADYRVYLVVTEAGQIRHNALEACRVIVHKTLSSSIGESNYLFRIIVYPHHVLRENKMMAFAGADRLQDGMRQAFGKPIGTAARVYPGRKIAEVWVKREHLEVAKKALKIGGSKLPLSVKIVWEPLNKSGSG
uniref:Large ribosomal subunit protein uL16 n=1 Tax=Fervidicoccus fontis TaxID=683846 RepID=A0A7J3ZJN1_9CREN